MPTIMINGAIRQYDKGTTYEKSFPSFSLPIIIPSLWSTSTEK